MTPLPPISDESNRERKDSPAEIVEVRFGECHSPAFLVELTEGDDSLLLRIRQRPQQNRVEHAEDRGRSANAEGQGDDGDDGEAGVFA